MPEPTGARTRTSFDATRSVHFAEACAEPQTLGEAFAAELAGAPAGTHRDVLAGVVLTEPAWLGHAGDRLHVRALMPGRGLAAAGNRVATIPIRYGAIADAFGSGRLVVDTIAVSATASGTLGISAGYLPEAITATLAAGGRLLVERNAALPDVAGAPAVPLDDAIVVIDTNRPPVAATAAAPSDTERRIAEFVASQIPDRATLSIGIGSLGDAVYAALAARHAGRRDLSLHSGMLADAARSLVDADALTAASPLGHAPLTTTMLLGSHALLAWAASERRVVLRPSREVHPIAVTSAIPRFCAVNFALEVDLEGNVGAETVGRRTVSGPGGQLDFAAGATASPGGVSVIALAARARNGASRIVPSLTGRTTTPRTCVDVVCTEFGVADLRGASEDERAARLRAIAAPEVREALAAARDAGIGSGP